jgi:DNA-directed RNA polymerase subunit RPC12/RpoP
MSEFKYACPVCGQHMMCDASQGGSVMECPTCFQKIIAPQAPTKDSKFILTGTKVSEKKISVRGVDAPVAATPAKKFPGVAVVGLILAFMAIAAAAIYWATIIHPRQAAAKNPPAPTNAVAAAKPAKPPLVAPAANDANWTLDLGTNALASSPVAGRIHGQDFIAERTVFQNGTLTFRLGTKGAMEFGAQINFGSAQPESLSGQTLNITADPSKSARVTLRWKDDGGTVQKDSYENNYAMRLEFGPLANNHLPGKIWLCTPDAEKSYLLGAFVADARKAKPKPAKK